MNRFDQMLEMYLKADYDQLVKLASDSATVLLPVCKEMDTENDGFLMLSSIILSAIGADGILTLKEKRLLSLALGISEETVSKYITMYSDDMVELADKFADSLSSEVKVETLQLLCAIIACDNTVTPKETALLRKILN